MRGWSTPFGPIAPDQDLERSNAQTIPAVATNVVYREPVQPLREVPRYTLSAGQEVARVPIMFSEPNPLRRLYQRMTGGRRTTLVTTQLETAIAPQTGVFHERGMNPPYEVPESQPWYSQFMAGVR